MASRALLRAMIIAAVVASAAAVDHMVGDTVGWTTYYNYTTWAQGKDFRVGDTLTFMYPKGSHNVVKVNGTDFQNCTNTNSSTLTLSSGNDVIPLKMPGKKWYICTFEGHCSLGMKLVITVSDAASAPAPTPGTSAAPSEFSALKSMWMLAAVAAAYGMIMA